MSFAAFTWLLTGIALGFWIGIWAKGKDEAKRGRPLSPKGAER